MAARASFVTFMNALESALPVGRWLGRGGGHLGRPTKGGAGQREGGTRGDRNSPPPQEKSRYMYYGEHGVAGFVVEGGGGGERDNRLPALRPTRPHTLGYIGAWDCRRGGDQKEGGTRGELEGVARGELEGVVEVPVAHPAEQIQGYLAHKKPPTLGPYSVPMPRALW